VKYLDYHHTATSIVCERCGAEFLITEEAVEHVEDYHMTDEQFDNPILALAMVAKTLSPNPIPPEAHNAST